jgi:hypothetical protein
VVKVEKLPGHYAMAVWCCELCDGNKANVQSCWLWSSALGHRLINLGALAFKWPRYERRRAINGLVARPESAAGTCSGSVENDLAQQPFARSALLMFCTVERCPMCSLPNGGKQFLPNTRRARAVLKQ